MTENTPPTEATAAWYAAQARRGVPVERRAEEQHQRIETIVHDMQVMAEAQRECNAVIAQGIGALEQHNAKLQGDVNLLREAVERLERNLDGLSNAYLEKYQKPQPARRESGHKCSSCQGQLIAPKNLSVASDVDVLECQSCGQIQRRASGEQFICSQCNINATESKFALCGECVWKYIDNLDFSRGQAGNPERVGHHTGEGADMIVPPLPAHPRVKEMYRGKTGNKGPAFCLDGGADWVFIDDASLESDELENCCCLARCWWLDEQAQSPEHGENWHYCAANAQAWAAYGAARGKGQ